MSPRTLHHAKFLAGVANQSIKSTSELLSGLEGERIISLPEVARLNGTSVDTIKRHYGKLILRMSDKRIGMKLKHALNLAQPFNIA
jgi:hypothetical protein